MGHGVIRQHGLVRLETFGDVSNLLCDGVPALVSEEDRLDVRVLDLSEPRSVLFLLLESLLMLLDAACFIVLDGASAHKAVLGLSVRERL